MFNTTSNTTSELLKQIRLGEDSTLELKDLKYKGAKVSAPHRYSMADELAAMANTAGGVLVLGIDDSSKSIIGIPEDKLDLVETWVRNICNDLIQPQLPCLVRKIPIQLDDNVERIIIRIDVPAGLFIHQSPGGYFHRVGSSKRQIPHDLLARLFQQRSQTGIIRFDEQAVKNAPRDCLEKTLWEKFKTPYSSNNDEDFLLKIKLLTLRPDGNISPSVSGILMACKQPEAFLTNAFIQAVFYRGTEHNAAYQLDAKDITGTLDVQIAEACQFVEKNMKIYAQKEPARQDIPQYARQSVFEALVNAVAHRDYSIYGSKIRLQMFSDRLEIFSPGSLVNTMEIKSLSERQACRNELLSSLLARCSMPAADFTVEHRITLMDRRGEGVSIIFSESENLSGRCPVYRLIDNAELMLTIFGAAAPNQ